MLGTHFPALMSYRNVVPSPLHTHTHTSILPSYYIQIQIQIYYYYYYHYITRTRCTSPGAYNISVDKNMVSSSFFFFPFVCSLLVCVIVCCTHQSCNDHFRLFPIMTMTSVFFGFRFFFFLVEKKDPLLRDRRTFCGATFNVYSVHVLTFGNYQLRAYVCTRDAVIWRGIRCAQQSSWGPKSKTT